MNSCKSSRGPCATVGDGRKDEAPGRGRMEWSDSESGDSDGMEVGVAMDPRSDVGASPV